MDVAEVAAGRPGVFADLHPGLSQGILGLHLGPRVFIGDGVIHEPFLELNLDVFGSDHAADPVPRHHLHVMGEP